MDLIFIAASMETSICSQIFMHKGRICKRRSLFLTFLMPCLDIGKAAQDSAYTVVIAYGKQLCNLAT